MLITKTTQAWAQNKPGPFHGESNDRRLHRGHSPPLLLQAARQRPLTQPGGQRTGPASVRTRSAGFLTGAVSVRAVAAGLLERGCRCVDADIHTMLLGRGRSNLQKGEKQGEEKLCSVTLLPESHTLLLGNSQGTRRARTGRCWGALVPLCSTADWCNCSQEAARGSGTSAAWCGESGSGSAEAGPRSLQEPGKRRHLGQILLSHLEDKRRKEAEEQQCQTLARSG